MKCWFASAWPPPCPVNISGATTWVDRGLVCQVLKAYMVVNPQYLFTNSPIHIMVPHIYVVVAPVFTIHNKFRNAELGLIMQHWKDLGVPSLKNCWNIWTVSDSETNPNSSIMSELTAECRSSIIKMNNRKNSSKFIGSITATSTILAPRA